MAKSCPYCGRELACIGGYYYPIYEECECERRAREQRQRESEERCRQIAAQRATCSHSWERRIQSGVGYEYCPKCGASRPTGGGSWF